MHLRIAPLVVLFFLAWCIPDSASVFYVNVNNASPAAPYNSWNIAATNIQQAVDLAASGDTVLVTNGVYASGGRLFSGDTTTNRLVVTNAIVVQSVNGPAVTVIQGYQMPVSTNGVSAIRCVCLNNGATLVGFSLRGGATQSAGYGGGVRCFSTNVTTRGCVFTGNSAASGGAMVAGVANNCIFSNNFAIGASGYGYGGAGYAGIFNNCLFVGNAATYGGAVASPQAGSAILNNCTVYGNSATNGGGLYSLSTVAVNYLFATNCIVVDNQAPNGSNYFSSSFVILNDCCVAPVPSSSAKCFANDPAFVNPAPGNFHLQTNSPCINAGTATAATSTDLDGNSRVVGPYVDLGAYECQSNEPVPIFPSIQANYTAVATGVVVTLTGQFAGNATASSWNFGDGSVISNRLPTVTHSWNLGGDYPIILTGYNSFYPTGISANLIVHVLANPIHYVVQNNPNPVAPYLSWSTAATNIQDAVNAAYINGQVVVSNGIYAYGGAPVSGAEGTAMNRVFVLKPLIVRSVNGSAVTTIIGTTTNDAGPVRCVCLTNNTALLGFTLTNGATPPDNLANDVIVQSGGGVCCFSSSGVISDCLVIGNTANYEGGGAYSGTLENCVITGNTAFGGGGTYASSLGNCTVVSNSASFVAGGSSGGTLLNSILYHNTAADDPNYDYQYFTCVLSNCCTIPLPANGSGNITNDPAFVNPAGGDYHLQSASPCINSGNNAFVPPGPDLDGNPRIQGGTVDIGAYEYQTPASVLGYAWAMQYGFPLDGSVDYVDSDQTGMNNFQKWIAGLNPTNPTSVLAMLPPLLMNNPRDIQVAWQSVATRTYYLQRATNLAAAPAFTALQSNLVGQAGITVYTDTTATNSGPYFYRVGVQ
jgi:hypothetical protein